MDRQISTKAELDMVIRVPFTESERNEFNNYIKENTQVKSRFVKKVILAAIREGRNDQ